MPGWVTVFGRVNHLGAEKQAPRSTQPEPAGMRTQRQLGEYTGTSRDTLARDRGLAVFAGVWLK